VNELQYSNAMIEEIAKERLCPLSINSERDGHFTVQQDEISGKNCVGRECMAFHFVQYSEKYVDDKIRKNPRFICGMTFK